MALLGEQSFFLGYTTLYIGGIFLNFIPRSFHPCVTHGAITVLIAQ